MINYKVLLKAIRFMFLPSCSILFVIFIAFFSFTDFLNFITSKSVLAIIIRILLVIAEAYFTYCMYKYYLKMEIIENGNISNLKNIIKEEYPSGASVYEFFKDKVYNIHTYNSYITESDDVIIVERKIK